MLLDKYLPRIEFDSYEDFKQNYRVNVPETFNFGFDIVDEWAKQEPEKKALVWCDDDGNERTFTFTEISRLSNQTANYFHHLGIRKGTVVMLILRRRWEYWVCAVALHKIGAILIPGSLQLSKKDLVYRGNSAGIHTMICVDDAYVIEQVEAAQSEVPSIQHRVLVAGKRDGWQDFEEEIAKYSDVFPRPTGAAATKANETAIVYFTSGTTGDPKMVQHNHAHPLGHIVTAKYWQQVQENKLHMSVSDSGWAKFGWGKIYGQWICGAVIFAYDMKKFIPTHLLQKMQDYKLTTFCAPPTLYRILVKMDMSKYNLSSLRYCTTAGEALNPEVFYKFKELTGFTIYEGFGQTETTLTIGNLENTTPRPGSMGKASPLYDVRIMRPDGTFAEAGETGEIVINIEKGEPDGLFIRYENDLERTAEIKRDGYYHTGDTAYKDEDGYFWFVGRVDDIIKVAGYRVGPFEIENEIMRIPYVLECAVTSVPDSTRGQAIKATVVLTEGTVGDEALKRDMKRYFKENIASYKRPRVIEFVKEMPKTISGKVRRVEIKEKDWK